MTTMAKVDETLARFDRKSPQESYRQICDEDDVHMQHDLYKLLPDVPMAWHRIHSLELDNFLLGTKGCMTLLPIITVSTVLRKISVNGCGVADDFIKKLCETLQSHPSVRFVDASNNPLITVYSASPIISLMKNNTNMVNFDVDNTHIGTNVNNIIASLGEKNKFKVATYYEDKYFKMKDLFGYLDENGQGWVPLKSLLLNCPYPVLQEQFAERIALKRPKKRSDNSISINTFMQLVYMNYKTENEISQFANGAIDLPYAFITANWKQVLAALDRYNTAHSEQRLRVGNDFHRLRIRTYLLANHEADALVACAADMAENNRNENAKRGNEAVSGDSKKPLTLHAAFLIQASKSAYRVPRDNTPEYHFFKERDAAYIPSVLRQGSRMFDLNDIASLNSSISSVDGTNGSMSGTTNGNNADEQPHTFKLPCSVVKMIVDFFNREVGKLPKKKESVIPDTPRTKKDKAMEKAAIPITTFLSAEFVNDLEKIRPRLLADYYSRYALPIEDCTITLQEMVNVLDELYVECRIDALIKLEQIEAMPNPLAEEKYANMFIQHLNDRDEDNSIVQAKRQSVAYV